MQYNMYKSIYIVLLYLQLKLEENVSTCLFNTNINYQINLIKQKPINEEH